MFVIINAEGRLEPSQLLKADSRNSQESSPRCPHQPGSAALQSKTMTAEN